MRWLKDKVFDTDVFRQIRESLGGDGRILLKNVPGSLPMMVATYLNEVCERPLLIVAESLEDAEEYADDLTALLADPPLSPPRERGGERGPCLLPGLPTFGRELTAVEKSERAEVLLVLAQGDHPLVVTTAAALLDPLPKPGAVSANMYLIAKGETLMRDSLLKYLIDSGYKREQFVESVGEFAVRGAVVDIYPFGKTEPVRLEYFGDEVESIRTFDSSSQKSTGEINDVILVAAELPESQDSHLLEHLSANTVILWAAGRASWNAVKKSFEDKATASFDRRFRKVDVRNDDDDLDDDDDLPADDFADPIPMDEDEIDDEPILGIEEDTGKYRAAHLPLHNENGKRLYVNPDVVRKAARTFTQVFLETAPHTEDHSVNLNGLPQERFAANLPLVADRLKEYHATGIRAVLLSDSTLAGDRLAQVLRDRGCPDEAFEVMEGGLHHGFTLPSAKLAVLVDHDIFGRLRRRRRFMKFKNVVPLHDIDALKPGDYVVHVDYGIGRYLGMTKIGVGGLQREVLKIEYKDGVTLFVKLENLAQVQKYSGREGFQPPLSKIGGKDWRELKKKTKKSLMSIAEDLIKLYAQRKSARGIAFSEDTPWQREMEASFPYEDTPDQQKVAEEVKQDMQGETPMDRLVCGDVGYGKTEVAMRAAFKAVTDGKQVAVLVPTTILAQQHYRTFRERLKSWPVRVDVISRFQGPREQRQTLKKLADGEVDVLIGTHRMLSKDVLFNDLGLLIVDEEHRFGVIQKEKLKTLRSDIDVLSMSATPIPRTLHMSLMGARDLSQINTPPPNRQPIETDVIPFSEKLIKDAILHEVQRGGQVFFIHNRVQSIDGIRKMLQRLLPSLRFAVAHGQMEENHLSRIMVDFIEGRYDVLISTMIVESGLDLPNVNTMIVNRADRFGVAQLHQLRGRIGRSSRKAYAYLLVPPQFEVSRVARQRLAALTNFSSLGAGFQVAMRDLEIRGAGNLLGREQSGYINAVGFEMYQQLIEEAVHDVKVDQTIGDSEPKQPEKLRMDLEADAFFPENYMPDGGMRLNFYRELSRSTELSRVKEIQQDVQDRFGRMPEPAAHLFDMMRVRILGEKMGAEKISIKAPEMRIEYATDIISREQILEIAARSEGYPVEFVAGASVVVRLPLGMMKEWPRKLEYLIRYLEKVAGKLETRN